MTNTSETSRPPHRFFLPPPITHLYGNIHRRRERIYKDVEDALNKLGFAELPEADQLVMDALSRKILTERLNRLPSQYTHDRVSGLENDHPSIAGFVEQPGFKLYVTAAGGESVIERVNNSRIKHEAVMTEVPGTHGIHELHYPQGGFVIDRFKEREDFAVYVYSTVFDEFAPDVVGGHRNKPHYMLGPNQVIRAIGDYNPVIWQNPHYRWDGVPKPPGSISASR